MNVKKLIGIILIATPFIALAYHCLLLDGVKCLVLVFGGVVLTLGIVSLGVVLITK